MFLFGWAASLLGFSLEKTLLTTIMRLTGFRSPSAFMNLLLSNPVVAINKIANMPPKYLKQIEKQISKGVFDAFEGAVELKIDFKKLAEQVNKDSKATETIKNWTDKNVLVKKNKIVDINKDAVSNMDPKATKKLESEVGQFVKMSSSWVQGGVIKGFKKNNELEVTIYFGSKGYDFDLKRSTWNRMVRAIGSHGTGAGSVLWDTELRHRKHNVARLRSQKGR